MGRLTFYIVDVFAEEKYAGNQLAVFPDALSVPSDQMQRIACEMHFSETTFIQSGNEDEGYAIRIFTPREELPFAGHPILGTAYIILRELTPRSGKSVVLNCPAGPIPVNLTARGDQSVLWMHLRRPAFGEILVPELVAEVIGIARDDMDGAFPVQEVSTGLPVIIVPLRSLDAVRRVRIDPNRYADLIRNRSAKCILVFSRETYHPDYDLNVRFFADYYGVPEDPATGSANGCLAAYLSRYRYFGSPEVHVTVEQGIEIRRPSLLYLEAIEKDGAVEVQVGGCVQLVARGEFV
jgi:trans-2,3-dihydro-3-hydroxyanthranilate isomerase